MLCEVLFVVPNEVIESYAVPGDVLYLQTADSLVERVRLVDVVLYTSVPEGAPAERTGAVLSTVTTTDEEVVVLLAASRATAVRV